MKKLHVLVLIILLLITTGLAHAQQPDSSPNSGVTYGLRTNLIAWATSAANLGVDVQWNARWQAGLTIAYGGCSPITEGKSWMRLRQAVQGEGRYYLNKTSTPWSSNSNTMSELYRGWYVGLSATYFEFDNALISTPRVSTGCTMGPLLGYSFSLYKNKEHKLYPLTLDIALGVGYIYQDYNLYEWYPTKKQNRYLGSDSSSSFGVTHAEIGLVYHF